jgi:anti-sigma regulatory factor (Ser/Thr protein kinase)
MAARRVHELLLPGDRHVDAWRARRFVGDVAAGRVPETTLFDMQLVVNELVTNALLHGLPRPISLIVHVRRRRASIAVAGQSDTRAEIPHVSEWGSIGLNGRTGRGLTLVDRAAHRVKVERWGESLTVTCYFRWRKPPELTADDARPPTDASAP